MGGKAFRFLVRVLEKHRVLDQDETRNKILSILATA
jgi:hypothetical protein